MSYKRHIQVMFILLLAFAFAFCGCKSKKKSSVPIPVPATPDKVTSPSPVDGATDVPVTSNLSWGVATGADSYDVYFGTDQADVAGADTSSAEFMGNQTGLTYDPGTLSYSTTYYWRIDSVNAAGVTTGDVWSFTTEAEPLSPPDQVTGPFPADGAVDVSVTVTTSWSAATGADSYDVYLGTDQAAVAGADTSSAEFMGNQTGLTYDPGTLDYLTTYYWRIDSVNAAGVTTGLVWSFTTEAEPLSPPDQVTGPNPGDGAVDVPVTTDLSWASAAGADSYDVYLGIEQTAVADADTASATDLYRGNQTGLTYDPGTLDYLTTYYWRIDSANTAGATTGLVWSFTTETTPSTPPDQVTGPYPADGAVDVATDIVLTWDAASGAESYDVYFGTDQILVSNADPSSAEFKGNQTELSYDPGTLDYETAYYWRIDSANTTGVTTGLVWSFTTVPAGPPVGTPDAVSNPFPPDESVDVPVSVVTNWSAATSAYSYDVYFGTDSTLVESATRTASEFMCTQTRTFYDPSPGGNLAYETTYYWRVDSLNALYTTKGPLWSFTTETTPVIAPAQAANPDPEDGAVDVEINKTLSWDAASGAESYDVYIGTDQAAVSTADHSSTELFKGNQTDLRYYPGVLENSTDYYWRIDSINTAGTTLGFVWAFTTGDQPASWAELYGESIETDEIIFVIDRTGSMRVSANMTIDDENGVPVQNPKKIDVARIGAIKVILSLEEHAKFAIVGFSTGGTTGASMDPNWTSGGGDMGGSWSAWPPANEEPAPLGYHWTYDNNIVTWPTAKTLQIASEANKLAAIAWCQQRFSLAEVSGGTNTYDAMSEALKMVTPAPPGPGISPTALYLLTDGAPSNIETVTYILLRIWGSYDAGEFNADATWAQQCMDLTRSKILSENVHSAKIFTAGLGMDMACHNAYVWHPGKMDWDIYPTEYNDRCRQFLTDLAEATDGYYNEICK